MDSPGVVIEVPAAARDAAERGPLLAACSSVIARGDCVMSPETRDAIAIVRFEDPAGLTVHIEVRLRREGGDPWMTESVAHFRADDPQSERWQSLGLLIGAATGQLQAAAAPSSPIIPVPAIREEKKTASEPSPPPPITRPPPAPAALKDDEHRFRARIGPGIRVELADVAPMLGASVDAGFRVHDWVQLRVTVSYAHGDRPADVTIDEVGFFAGLGLRLFRMGGLFGAVLVDTGPVLLRAENATSAGQRIVGASRLGFDLGQDFDWFTVGLTTTVQRDWSRTNIRVNGDRTGEASVYSVQWAALLGATF